MDIIIIIITEERRRRRRRRDNMWKTVTVKIVHSDD